MPKSGILATVHVRYLVGMSRGSILPVRQLNFNTPIEHIPWKTAKHLDNVR